MRESILTSAIAELGSGDVRTLLSRTERSTSGSAAELRPRLREAVREEELAPEDVLRRLDEDALLAIVERHELEEPRSKKHADLLHSLAALIRREPSEVSHRRRRKKSEAAPSELEQLREDVDRLLDEREKLEAKVRRLEREGDHGREPPGLDAAPPDLSALLRSIGVNDAAAFKRIYRPAVKLLHPDKNPEGAGAFRVLTRIREILEGRS